MSGVLELLCIFYSIMESILCILKKNQKNNIYKKLKEKLNQNFLSIGQGNNNLI